MTKRQRITIAQEAAQNRMVAYLRVSTAEQGESGLGLEAQRAAVAAYATSAGRTVLAEYQDVESGRHNDRPGLALAIAHAKRAKATLVIAKLDRLARNVAFVSKLMESKVEFVACDNPHATKLTIHILVAVAEDEAERISARTKAALAAAKARGTKLGAPEHLTAEARIKGRAKAAIVSQQAKVEAYEHVSPLIHELRDQGLSLNAIAKQLNERGETLRSTLPWNAVQVRRVLLMEIQPALPFRGAAA